MSTPRKPAKTVGVYDSPAKKPRAWRHAVVVAIVAVLLILAWLLLGRPAGGG